VRRSASALLQQPLKFSHPRAVRQTCMLARLCSWCRSGGGMLVGDGFTLSHFLSFFGGLKRAFDTPSVTVAT
jgi:hypothetical protein